MKQGQLRYESKFKTGEEIKLLWLKKLTVVCSKQI